MAGRSALAVFPTGGGKSVCYQLPALLLPGVTLVISPLIALMKDQIDFLTRRGIPAAKLDSSLSAEEVREIHTKLRGGELKLLYVAPERFQNERFLAELGRLSISLMAIDEAHCISEWGHNFRPDYLKLAGIARDIRAERVLALTATATPDVVRDICRAFQIAAPDAVVTGFARPNLAILTTPVPAKLRATALRDRLLSRPAGSTIVYVSLQQQAEQLAAYLQQAGLPAEAYHAGMPPEAREATQNRWAAARDGIVVATIAFGMGIDKADVRYVYHANMPKSLEAYSQEIGRAGRDGLPATVEWLVDPQDLRVLENFVYGDTPLAHQLARLLDYLVSQPGEIAVSQYELSQLCDLRPLVLRTALTYLELRGALLRGTSFYAGYEFRPLRPMDEVTTAFPGVHGEFVASLFGAARRGRIWYALDPDRAADQLQVPRNRILRALEVMEERGLIELRSSDVRDRYERRFTPEEVPTLLRDLVDKFERREHQELARLESVSRFPYQTECHAMRLATYFGQLDTTPCGHCSVCQGQIAVPVTDATEAIDLSRLNSSEWFELRSRYPNELREPRQAAKFLCGLTSPAFTRAKLSRNPLFGALTECPFDSVVKALASATEA